MQQSIGVITLGVQDLARSRRFYVDGLGWRPVLDSDQVIFFQANSLVFALWRTPDLLADAGLSAAGRPAGSGSVALAHNVRDRATVDRVMAEAAAAGATITRPAEAAFWGGYTGYFSDPDGHLWEVAWNPAWPIDAAGGVTYASADKGSDDKG